MHKLMKQERTTIGALLLLQLVLWLGFVVHRSPRFPGSVTGITLGVAAALLMVAPSLFYAAVKRRPLVRTWLTKHMSVGVLLQWHVYTGIVGSILAVLHTGHRFGSTLGIWLTALMLLTVFSGFVGRYFLAYSSQELHEKQDMLNLLSYEYNQLVSRISKQPDEAVKYAAPHLFFRRALSREAGAANVDAPDKVPLSMHALQLADAIADLEYAIKTHELAKRRTKNWLWTHIVTSVAFYLLLLLHIWAAFYYSL